MFGQCFQSIFLNNKYGNGFAQCIKRFNKIGVWQVPSPF